jgi:hypothetical protein
MAYPSVHKFDVVHRSAHCSSIGGSPVATYIYAPFRGQLMRIDAVVHGTITTADCSVAVAVNGTAISGSPMTISVSGAGAGQVATLTPTSPTYVNDGDYITITPSGASGSNIAATFSAAIKSR